MSLGPIVQPILVEREEETGTISKRIQYTFTSLERDNIDRNPRSEPIEDDWVVYHGDMGDIFFHDGHAHVKHQRYEQTKMLVLQEAVMDALSDINSDGLVNGLKVERELP